jgi:hypothetical protein
LTIEMVINEITVYRGQRQAGPGREQHGIGGLVDIEPFHVAAYIKALKVSEPGDRTVRQRAAARPTVKQHLAAIRMLFDWLIVGQVSRSTRRMRSAW